MYLSKLHLLNFKNYETVDLQFSPQVNCLVGDNGSGKTNLLDAIYYLSLTKSAFNKTDSQNIRHGEPFFSVCGMFVLADAEHLVQCSLKVGEKKTLKCDKVPYERMSEHIGRFPVVMIAPDDTALIREGSEERRKFVDGIIAQIDPAYLQNLLHYNYYLQQRNSLLKQFADKNYFDPTLLQAFDEPLLTLNAQLYKRRQLFVDQFTPLFTEHYLDLSDSREQVNLVYQTQLHEPDFAQHFQESRRRDLVMQRTHVGIHKDDFVFTIDNFPLKKFGSQGQQKSFLIALKLAQFDIVHIAQNSKPLLLLDDIFDKLDDKRIARMLQMITENRFGQIFITDARPERSQKIFEHVDAEVSFYDVNKGQVDRLTV